MDVSPAMMGKLRQANEGSAGFDLLVKWLERKNQKRNAVARAMLCRLGQPATEFLIKAATADGKGAAHIVRLLDVIEEIGAPLGPDDYQMIWALSSHPSKKVRDKLLEVFKVLLPNGPPSLLPPEVIQAARAIPARCLQRVLSMEELRREGKRRSDNPLWQ